MSDEGLLPVPDDLDLGATIKGFAPGQMVFERYTLKKIVGRGGMGVVWLARDEKLEEEIALKFLPEMVRLDAPSLDELKRETRRSRSLTHAHIVRIYDFVEDAMSAGISMEYIDGPSLSGLRMEKPLRVFSLAEITPWLRQLCEALVYAHEKAKIAHRDLKPANLMINSQGDLKVADFGIASSLSDSISRVTMSRGSSGTLAYMSPQQALGKKPTPTDDIYSLGATIFEMLTSKPPFYSGNIQHQLETVVPPSMTERRADLEIEGEPIPSEWEATVAACLAKEPSGRPQSVAEVAERLGLESVSAIRGKNRSAVETPATATSSPARPEPPKKSRVVLIASILVILIAVAGLGYYFGVVAPAEKARHAEIARQVEIQKEKDAEAKAATDAQQKAQLEAQAKQAADEAERLKTEAEKAQALADQKAAADKAAADAKKAADDAAQQQQAALAAIPAAAQDSFNKGTLASQQQDYILAARFFEEARKAAPDASIIYYDLGQTESKIPGRELRTIAWYSAYLAANPNAPEAATLKVEIENLDVKSQGNLLHLIQSAQDAAGQTDSTNKEASLAQVAGLWAGSGDMATAQKVVDSLSDSYWSSVAYGDIAEALTDAGDLAGALKMADLIRPSGTDAYQVSGIATSKINTLKKIAAAQKNTGDLEGAKNTLVLAQKAAGVISDPGPRAQALAGVASDQADAGDINGALETLTVAQAASAVVVNRTSPVSNDAFWTAQADERNDIYRARVFLARAQANAGDIAGAQKTLDLMRQSSDSKSWAQQTLVEAQVKAGDLDAAQKTADLITNAGDKKSAEETISNHRRWAVEELADTGDIAGAQKASGQVENASDKNGAWEAIANAQAKMGDIAGAQKTADQILNDTNHNKERAEQDIGRAQNEIVGDQLKASDLAGAQKNADTIQEPYYKSAALDSIALAQAKAGDMAGALKTAALFPDASLKGGALAEIAEAQVKAGDVTGAKETLANALKNTDSIQAPLVKIYSLEKILEIQVKAGDIPGARETVGMALKIDISAQEPTLKCLILTTIAEAQGKVGDNAGAATTMDSVQKIIDLISDAKGKDSARNYISMAQEQTGDFVGALKTADLIQSAGTKGSAQESIVGGQVTAGDMEGAQKTIDLMQDAHGKDWAHYSIVTAQIKAADIAGAQKTVDLIQDNSVKDAAREAVAKAQAQTGDSAGAQKTVDLIQDTNDKSDAQFAVFRAQAKAGLPIKPIPVAKPTRVAQAPAPPTIPPITDKDWLNLLNTTYGVSLLSSAPFLDLAGYLKTLPSANPGDIFNGLHDTAVKIVNAQNVVDRMLKQQAAQTAAKP